MLGIGHSSKSLSNGYRMDLLIERTKSVIRSSATDLKSLVHL